jgi:hypothetical protein
MGEATYYIRAMFPEFGALRAGWVSDEELDPYDNIQMR